ncbi:MAG: DNA-directed RNA polymerase subunit alpha [Firmicutes bacterium]|nr:DNA-directed RNA polymerase subunit alpha [Bacillota bacterium]
MMEIDKPKISMTEEHNGATAKFVVEPLERGYGTTLGNTLRRTMLSSLPGIAPIAIKIAGVNNEFSTIKGVREDVTDIVLNVKTLVLKTTNEDPEFRTTLRISKSSGVVRASDIEKNAEVTICNPDLEICNLDGGTKFEMDIIVANGRGYVVAREHKGLENIGVIAVDSSFSPVTKCNYYIESARVGQKIDYDKLVLEVSTNGSIEARNVISLSSKIVQDHLGLFTGLVPASTHRVELTETKEDAKVKILETNIEDMELSPRSSNCLKRANINTIEDLTRKTKSDMLRVRNLGSKSLEEIILKLEAMGLGLRAEEDGGI